MRGIYLGVWAELNFSHFCIYLYLKVVWQQFVPLMCFHYSTKHPIKIWRCSGDISRTFRDSLNRLDEQIFCLLLHEKDWNLLLDPNKDGGCKKMWNNIKKFDQSCWYYVTFYYVFIQNNMFIFVLRRTESAVSGYFQLPGHETLKSKNMFYMKI